MASKLPTLFLAHGSPVNALADNEFTRALKRLGDELPRPKAVLIVSAHWRSRTTKVLTIGEPKTIYDFSGFPKELSEIVYPAKGAASVALRVATLLTPFGAEDDESWGLDHGVWSVLRHMYPAADVPVVPLSINQRLHLDGHLAVASALRPLREEGVLIIGSGNITHNLGDIDWDENAAAQKWATSFDARMAKALVARDEDFLLKRQIGDYASLWSRALPTAEHYIPLVYAYGASDPSDQVIFPYEGMQHGTLSMRCVQFGVK
ncbi:MAG: 4,5-DOPA dioxygenase extradiol [Deltaproteobacteria bacterium]|nr:4,5-DOPA dioxygenase extradiol [Deltaproteobacteria bacterium]